MTFVDRAGFDAISTAAQEARSPQRDVPIATMASLGISTALYVVVALVMTGLVPFASLDVSDPIAVAVDAAGAGLAWVRPVVKLGALAGLTSVALVSIYGQVRRISPMRGRVRVPVNPTPGTRRVRYGVGWPSRRLARARAWALPHAARRDLLVRVQRGRDLGGRAH